MVTGFYAGLLGVIYIMLFAHVVRKRVMHKVSIGDGGHEDLAIAMRKHGNFIEYVPFALIMMGYSELSSLFESVTLHGLGIALIVGRLSHIYGMCAGTHIKFRQAGMVLTVATILIPSFAFIAEFVTAYI